MALTLRPGEQADIGHEDDRTTVTTSLDISASPEAVWTVLTDFKQLPEWSPGLIAIEGPFEKGAEIVATFRTGVGSLTQDFHRPLTFLEEGCEFGWSGDSFLGMKDNHIYRIAENGDGTTRFHQSDAMIGKAEHYVGHMMASGMLSAYVEFNRALKKRCERKADK